MCMCGDLYCHSCGPAQGNFRCPACGRWNLDGGCEDPEVCESVMDSWDESLAEAEAEIAAAAEEFWASK